jgi:hypothetical protein
MKIALLLLCSAALAAGSPYDPYVLYCTSDGFGPIGAASTDGSFQVAARTLAVKAGWSGASTSIDSRAQEWLHGALVAELPAGAFISQVIGLGKPDPVTGVPTITYAPQRVQVSRDLGDVHLRLTIDHARVAATLINDPEDNGDLLEFGIADVRRWQFIVIRQSQVPAPQGAIVPNERWRVWAPFYSPRLAQVR